MARLGKPIVLISCRSPWMYLLLNISIVKRWSPSCKNFPLWNRYFLRYFLNLLNSVRKNSSCLTVPKILRWCENNIGLLANDGLLIFGIVNEECRTKSFCNEISYSIFSILCDWTMCKSGILKVKNIGQDWKFVK